LAPLGPLFTNLGEWKYIHAASFAATSVTAYIFWLIFLSATLVLFWW